MPGQPQMDAAVVGIITQQIKCKFADIVVKKTDEHSDQYVIKPQQTVNTQAIVRKSPKPQNGNVRKTPLQTSMKKPAQLQNPKQKKSESAPFSAVILICVIFFILAAIGFFMLFNALYGAKASEIDTSWIFSVKNTVSNRTGIGTGMKFL